MRSLILLNLGALVDLGAYFTSLPPSTLIHVIDSHRPINLNNLFNPAPYATAFFDMRRRRERRDEARERQLEELRAQSEAVNIVVWSDAEGDEGREGEKEAFEALQVRGILSPLGTRLTQRYAGSMSRILILKIPTPTTICRPEGEEVILTRRRTTRGVQGVGKGSG